MFFNRRSRSAHTKKFFLAPLFFLIPIFSLFSSEFPETLSRNAKISVLSVNYEDFSHSLFSKSCLRIFDTETNFDQIIDFAHFEDFDDDFFLLKFFLKSKRAFVRDEPFLDYFLTHQKRTNVSFVESVLNLSPEEVQYIFAFISTMHKTLPEYSYDFDILSDNSETHISQILHDCERMVGKPQTTKRFSFSEISKHNLSYKKLNDSFALVSERESFSLENNVILPNGSFHTNIPLLVTLIVFASIIFLLTAYQVVAYFFERAYFPSVFKTTQILDFLILFFSGLVGAIILYQDIFSDQTLFKNNFQFFYLVPLHLVAAFTIFKPMQSRKIQINYWSAVSVISFLYIFILSLSEKRFPVFSFLLAFPIFLRTVYFYFAVKNIKKERSFLPYALLLKFLNWLSS